MESEEELPKIFIKYQQLEYIHPFTTDRTSGGKYIKNKISTRTTSNSPIAKGVSHTISIPTNPIKYTCWRLKPHNSLEDGRHFPAWTLPLFLKHPCTSWIPLPLSAPLHPFLWKIGIFFALFFRTRPSQSRKTAIHAYFESRATSQFILNLMQEVSVSSIVA